MGLKPHASTEGQSASLFNKLLNAAAQTRHGAENALALLLAQVGAVEQAPGLTFEQVMERQVAGGDAALLEKRKALQAAVAGGDQQLMVGGSTTPRRCRWSSIPNNMKSGRRCFFSTE